MERFGLLTEDSVFCLSAYIDVLVSESFPDQPMGTLAQRVIALSFEDVKEALPM